MLLMFNCENVILTVICLFNKSVITCFMFDLLTSNILYDTSSIDAT